MEVGRHIVSAQSSIRIAPTWRVPPIIDRDDPQKGRWGGKSQRNGRRLTALVRKTSSRNWFKLTIKVEALRGSPDITDPVWFHLHDSFPRAHVRADKQTPRMAEFEIEAYGAFTVGAEIRGEAIRGQPSVLELGLCKLRRAPSEFRNS